MTRCTGQNWLPWYNWNIVENVVKYHNRNLNVLLMQGVYLMVCDRLLNNIIQTNMQDIRGS